MMQFRRYLPSDEGYVAPWYQAREDAFYSEWLPRDTGFIVEDDKSRLAVGFLLLTNSKMAFMEYLQTNCERTEFEQAKALIFLTRELEKLSKGLGYKVIIGLVPEDHFSLVKYYQKEKAHIGKKLMRLVYKGL